MRTIIIRWGKIKIDGHLRRFLAMGFMEYFGILGFQAEQSNIQREIGLEAF